MASATYGITELLDRLGLEYTDRKNADCPFCGAKKKLHISEEKNTWRCVKCSSSGGVLHFYARYKLGIESLPSSISERGKIALDLREFMGDKDADLTPRVTKPKPPVIRVPLADDNYLHEVYTAMAALPFLRLSDEHRAELKRRGLSDEAITQNGYRTIPAKLPNADLTLYVKEGGNQQKEAVFGTWRYSQWMVQIGLQIGAELTQQGFDLKGVPGFYKFGSSWSFFCRPGIMIPTRNIRGQIVIWQVRQNCAPKYMTLHCGSLPGAVTETVSRCHFPLGNAPISAKTPVIFTEGPLKADVAVFLMKQPCAFAAVPGINTTNDLYANIAALKSAGVRVMQNAFDMDKLTNPNVRKGVESITQGLNKCGMTVRQLYWGEHYAEYKCMVLTSIAALNNIPLPPASGSVFDQLNAVASALDAAGIPHSTTVVGKKKVHYYWEAETKGIDDYLRSI